MGAGLLSRVKKLESAAPLVVSADGSADLTRYRDDPVGFARDVLRVTLTQDQEACLRALLAGPYRVLAKSGHNVGKTFMAAVAVVWWFYTRPKSVIITTAPTERDVVDLLWTEIRLLVQRAELPDYFVGPSAPAMFDHEEHWAKGYTARKGESFQGRHRENMLFVFDEAEGVEATYWRTANTMFQGDGTHAWLAILNPTTTTSQSYQEERAVSADDAAKWSVFSISSLDHPNIAAGLAGLPLPVPNAVSVEQVTDWLGDWFERVDEPDAETDVEYPPGSGQWWRPGPDGEARVLGRRPSAGTFGVWSERLWAIACRVKLPPLAYRWELPEIGCDVARFGDDKTELHERCGPVSLHHEDHSGWDTVRTAARLMERADHLAAWSSAMRSPQGEPIDPKRIRIKVDDTGVGGGVTDIVGSHGYSVVPVNAGSMAADPTKYPRVRDELWFVVRDRARAGRLDLSRLPAKRLAKLGIQAMAPTWRPTPDRRRQVESKEDVKKRLPGLGSPDGMDAVNLSYWDGGMETMEAVHGKSERQR